MAADIPDEQAAKLRAHACASDRTLAQELRRAVRLYCAMLDRDRTPGQPSSNGSGLPAPAPSSGA